MLFVIVFNIACQMYAVINGFWPLVFAVTVISKLNKSFVQGEKYFRSIWQPIHLVKALK